MALAEKDSLGKWHFNSEGKGQRNATYKNVMLKYYIELKRWVGLDSKNVDQASPSLTSIWELSLNIAQLHDKHDFVYSYSVVDTII